MFFKDVSKHLAHSGIPEHSHGSCERVNIPPVVLDGVASWEAPFVFGGHRGWKREAVV